MLKNVSMKELIQLKKKGMFCETEHVNDLILYFHVKVLLKIQTYIKLASKNSANLWIVLQD